MTKIKRIPKTKPSTRTMAVQAPPTEIEVLQSQVEKLTRQLEIAQENFDMLQLEYNRITKAYGWK